MVQWSVHKLKKRWRYRRSREQFLNWNRGSATDGPVSSSQTESEVALPGWSCEQFTNWNWGDATDGPESSSQTEIKMALRMVQWTFHKLKKRRRFGWSREQFTNWNRGGATDGPDSSEQFINWNRGGATDGPVSSSQAETEVALQMVQWAVHKLKQRWRYRWFREQFTNWKWDGATDSPESSS